MYVYKNIREREGEGGRERLLKSERKSITTSQCGEEMEKKKKKLPEVADNPMN